LLQRRKRLPEPEDNEAGKAADKSSDDFGIAGRDRGGVDDADEDKDSREDEEEGANIIELSKGFFCGETWV
jgi:hypothetical protein